MDMNKGIDAQVSDRVNAYRGNPQQLMQMYQQNKELVDLLALQKLKSEKEAAKREIELQMQQQPGTIAQQREQEVMQMTKDELAQQTQGVLQRKQQQQQTNLQRAAQGGLGALAQQRPAPAPAAAPQGQPMPRMAGGGIVAFQVGGMQGLQGDLSIEEQIAIIQRRGDLNEGQKASLINQLRAMQPRAAEDRMFTTPVGRASSARMPGVQGNIPVGSETSALDVLSETAPRVAPNAAVARGETPDLSGLGQGPEQRLGPRGERANLVQGLEALAQGPTTRPNNAPSPAPATEAEAEATSTQPAIDTSATRTGIASLDGGSMGGAEAALMRGVKIGEDVLGRDEKAARYAEMEAQLAALDEELYDPEAERRQQLQAFLIGTAGATNVGYAMAGGAAAAINLENRQKQNRRSRMLSRIQLGERGMTLDTDIGKQALSLGTQMFADFNANKRAAISAGATLSAAQLRATSEAARLEFDRQRESNDQAYKMRDLDIREADNAIEQARNEQLDLDRRINGNLTATDKLLRISADAYEEGARRFGVEDASMALATLRPDDDGYEAAKAARDAAVAEANAFATEFLDLQGVNDRLEELERQYFELTGVAGMPGINPDDIEDFQVTGE